jgi:hypothetical protein
MTDGIVSMMASDSRNDWKFAANSRKITITATSKPISSPLNISRIGTTCPRRVTFTPCGGLPTFSST